MKSDFPGQFWPLTGMKNELLTKRTWYWSLAKFFIVCLYTKTGVELHKLAKLTDEAIIQASWLNKLSHFNKYTLFQNGRHFSILLFSCKLALFASFLNSKSKEYFP